MLSRRALHGRHSTRQLPCEDADDGVKELGRPDRLGQVGGYLGVGEVVALLTERSQHDERDGAMLLGGLYGFGEGGSIPLRHPCVKDSEVELGSGRKPFERFGR